MRVQEKTGVGWKRTSKYDVASEVDTALPRIGVGKIDIRIRAIESAGISYADADAGFNEITKSAFSNMVRSKTTSG